MWLYRRGRGRAMVGVKGVAVSHQGAIMRATLAAIIAVAALFIAIPARAATSQDTLASAALTDSDLGQGYSQVQGGPRSELTDQGVAYYLGLFVRLPGLRNPSMEFVVNVLADTAGDGAFDEAAFRAGVEQGFTGASGLTMTAADAPAIGQNTARWTVSGSLAGQDLSGDFILWRHGGVIAGVLTLSPGTTSGAAYAATQEAKLTAIVGPVE
jgi:hypothetical protein